MVSTNVDLREQLFNPDGLSELRGLQEVVPRIVRCGYSRLREHDEENEKVNAHGVTVM